MTARAIISLKTITILLALVMAAGAGSAHGAEDDRTTLEITIEKEVNASKVAERYLENPAADADRFYRLNRLSGRDRLLPGTIVRVPFGMLKEQPLGGSVSFVEGKVERRSEGRGWRQVKAGDTLIEGALIKTGQDGYAEITFDRGAVKLLLRPESELLIKKAVASVKAISPAPST